jgi:L-serine deaminase
MSPPIRFYRTLSGRALCGADLETVIAAMALTAKDMSAKYKQTSEGGLAVSVVQY